MSIFPEPAWRIIVREWRRQVHAQLQGQVSASHFVRSQFEANTFRTMYNVWIHYCGNPFADHYYFHRRFIEHVYTLQNGRVLMRQTPFMTRPRSCGLPLWAIREYLREKRCEKRLPQYDSIKSELTSRVQLVNLHYCNVSRYTVDVVWNGVCMGSRSKNQTREIHSFLRRYEKWASTGIPRPRVYSIPPWVDREFIRRIHH